MKKRPPLKQIIARIRAEQSTGPRPTLQEITKAFNRQFGTPIKKGKEALK